MSDSAWRNNHPGDVTRDGSVLLLGSGLTSIDMIMALKSKAFRGTIHVLSREGLIPSRHQQTQPSATFLELKILHEPRAACSV